MEEDKMQVEGKTVLVVGTGKDDFTLAAKNISDIILTLGSAIAVSYDGGTIEFSDGSSLTIDTGLNDVVDVDDLQTIIDLYNNGKSKYYG